MENAVDTNIFGGSFIIAPIGSQVQFIPEDLSDEAKSIGLAARDFMLGEVMPAEEAIEKLDIKLIKELVKKAGDLGFLGAEIPEEYDGINLDKKSVMLLMEEMGRQPSFSLTCGAHTGIGSLPIVYYGSSEQKATYLPDLCSGRKIAAYALTEAEAGSDATSLKTTAVLDGNSWVLNGSKMWITNAGFADIFIVFAKVDGWKLSAFIIEKNDPGFNIGSEEQKLGIKGSSTCALSFNNCRIPYNRLLGKIGRGRHIAFNILAIGRFKLGVSCTGAAKNVLQYTAKYITERYQFNKPLYSFGLIKQKIAEMTVQIFVSESMNFRTISYLNNRFESIDCDSIDSGAKKLDIMNEFAIEASIAKIFGSEALFAIADTAVQCFGGYGFSSEYQPEKIYRDNRVNRIFEGTNEINRLIIAATFLKKIGNGSIKLSTDTSDLPQLSNFRGLLAQSKCNLERLKRMFCYTTGTAFDLFGQKLCENQEICAHIANMLIDIYAIESSIVRADIMTNNNHLWSELARNIANSYLNEAWYKVKTASIMLLTEVLTGLELEKALFELNIFDNYIPQVGSKLHADIVAKVIDSGGYPILQY